ncbi:hypothetical protein CO174_03575 [Candidatus Uhrbacteria bacterium CG_4_9_14_3_um_filter_50_9]|uniref:Glycosyltransferase RgtA/B/C/D-like domain-containing protein n=1 Tax=Candidatus Uhrbacteria bacterium CG_4_9_14_3_um_filter_50_9 TaxID=1975035 RepID=A0A2M7XCD2_9BACT|nr:MAG: hypothetical protein CO174_03575 [Candidatus Uhrbacteria bacterium CG_4_9_14_3_um_filter_50_9]
MLRRFQLIILSVLFLAVFVGNTFVFESPTLGALLLAVYLGLFGWELGGVVTQTEKAVLRWWIGVWVLLSLVLIAGTVAYYVALISPEVIYLIILLTPPVVLTLAKKQRTSLLKHGHNLWTERAHRIPGAVFLITSLIILLAVLLLSSLFDHQVTESVRSVWERLPSFVFPIFFLLALLLYALLFRGKERSLTLVLFGVLLFTTVSVAAITFPLGFGFDSFIHKATEEHLAQFGTITPKPFYYIGQYALVLFAHHGFLLPVTLVDTYLVPFLLALLLPSAWYFAAAHITNKKSVSMTTLAGIFLLPLSGFIVTTPQGLANLWTLLLILASVPYLLEKEHPRLLVLALSGIATLLIHPIAGLPAMLYLVLLFSDPSRANPRTPVLNKLVRLGLIAFSCVVLPLSFLANALIGGQSIGVDWASLNPLRWIEGLNVSVFFENRFNPLLDFVYLYGLNVALLGFLIAGLAWWSYRKELSHRFRVLLLMVLALAVNYLIMSTTLEFTFLINYERSNYAARLVPLMSFFLAPLMILGLSHLFLNLKSRPMILRVSVVVLLAACTASAFYMAYPRRDAYETNRGFNVSQADIDAVYLVESLADGKPYLALANQSVSAAAINQLGFRYFGDLFFYPIPTGGELYDVFLDMNESPTRETAEAALDLVPMHGGVIQLYFLVNNYWWQAPRIIETAKSTADDWRSVGEGGQVYIFEYDLEP